MMRLKNLVLLAALPLALALSGCNTVSDLTYAPQVPVQPVVTPTVASVSTTDQRKEDPTRLATIIGGFGNPVKTLDLGKPVKDEVADAFAAGLKARGLLASSGQAPFRVEVLVRKFDADMIIGRTARLDFGLSVLDATGRTVFEDNATDSQSDMKFFQTGMFADIDDLRKLCEIILNRTVDRMLDNPKFRAAIQASAVKP